MTRGDRAELYGRWSSLHGGVDPASSVWIGGWVRLTDACAAPLARRRVAPDAVTVAGVVVTAAVPLVTAAGGVWPMVAVVVLVLGAVLDGVDGALASRTGTASAWGRVLDPLADRCSDLLLVLTLVVLGAPAWLGVVLGVLTLLLESVRSTAQAAGLDGPGAVTVWERPSRVIVSSFAAGLAGIVWLAREAGAGLLPAVDADLLGTAGAVIGVVLAAVGLVHLLVVVRRRLVSS